MTDRLVEKKGVAKRVFFATVALVGTSACEIVAVKDGDTGTIVRPTHCWQYAGGNGASRLEAPQGQRDNGTIKEGAGATIRSAEGDPFGPTSHFGTYLRVEVNGREVTPTLPADSACWIEASNFTPGKK